jgi:diguanylate cyclase (GGDEF)-like protein/PAS domain S-box-containing protein
MLDGTIVRWNPGASRVYGYSTPEIIGSCIMGLAPEERRGDLRRVFANVAQGERVQQYETANLTREGHLINVALTMSPMLNEAGAVTGICVIARDITEHVKLREELINLSLVDALTGLNNRRGFFHLANQQFKIARRTQNATLLIFADVDNMKWINDSLGHQSGDQALIDTADVLRRTFREADIIGRIGGDEFAVLAVEAQAVSTQDILTRLQRQLDARNTRDGHRFQLSLSVGLVDCRPDEPIAFDDVLAEADARMYEHKRSKKTTRTHSPEVL